MTTFKKILIVQTAKPAQRLSSMAVRLLESSRNNGNGGHCQGGGGGNW